MLKKKCDINIQKTIKLADAMILLARQGDEAREDSGCGVLYGTLLDSGFKLKQLALKEKAAHINKGGWQEKESTSQGGRDEKTNN
ncbi:MAG: hypothetical protein AB7U45_05170 [Desulfamplus sp.]